jgi:hypothetical protein
MQSFRDYLTEKKKSKKDKAKQAEVLVNPSLDDMVSDDDEKSQKKTK